MAARFLGPGFNQFQNWNNQNEESSDSPEEEEKPEAKKPWQQEDEEGWTDWKNGEDIRNRFGTKKKPGRIIHLGDGSELFTDRNVGDDDDELNAHSNKDVGEGSSSEEEEEEEEEDDKMQVDGVKAESEIPSKITALDTTAKTPETRYKSPTPTVAAPQSPSQR